MSPIMASRRSCLSITSARPCTLSASCSAGSGDSISSAAQSGLKDGTRRFNELRRDNPTVSHRILSLELRKLEAAGIVRRTAHAGYPLRVDYDLTDAGRRLVPLIDALATWWEESQAPAQPIETRDAVRAN
ncbi:helix-turn-helix transcriptional regulator [Leptolyngbya sp. 15MV]|nr:helix-turn-helix transcriptional regulator [Leptolyngbya sp. 15MV]